MPSSDELYAEAESLKNAGKLPEAIDKLNELLAADDAHLLAHLTLAVLYGKVGRHDIAVQHGERACQIEPTDPFNFTALSVCYQRAFAGTGDHSYIQKAEDAMGRSRMIQGH